MINIAGYGCSARIKASNTFPEGFNLTAFADDADAIDAPDLVIADAAMALNGELVVWNKANYLEAGFNVIPTSVDDVNLAALANANRVGKGKRGARDVITITVSYPDGSTATYGPGVMVVGSVAKSVAAAGRFKSRQYRFRFEGLSTAGEAGQGA